MTNRNVARVRRPGEGGSLDERTGATLRPYSRPAFARYWTAMADRRRRARQRTVEDELVAEWVLHPTDTRRATAACTEATGLEAMLPVDQKPREST